LKNNDLNETALQIAQYNGYGSIEELFRNPDAARARAAQLAAPEIKEPLDSTTMTMADFKKAVTPFNANSLGFKGRLLTEPGFKKQFGQPFQTQKFGEQAMWYYKCSDGLIQIVIEAAFLQQQGVVIKDINEQSLPGGQTPASDVRSTTTADSHQPQPVAQTPIPQSQPQQPREQDSAAPPSVKDTPSGITPSASTGKVEASSKQQPRQVDELHMQVQSLNNRGLWTAARSGMLAVVEDLMDDGAEVNSADPDGNTALILAAQKGHSQVVRYLRTKGADVGRTNRLGQTAMDVAKDEEMRTILKEAPKKN
jgi:hypothetical protein